MKTRTWFFSFNITLNGNSAVCDTIYTIDAVPMNEATLKAIRIQIVESLRKEGHIIKEGNLPTITFFKELES